MCVCVHMLWCLCMGVYMYVEVTGQQCLPQVLSAFIFETVSLTDIKLSDWTRVAGITDTSLCTWLSTRDLNSGPHAYVPISLAAQPLPGPRMMKF